MGVLEHRSGRRVTLGAHNEVGRSRRCQVTLDHKAASAHHAIVSWKNDSWQVRDLGSRNGTEVAGKRIEVGTPVELTAGAQLSFGAEHERWELLDATAPGARAHREGQAQTVAANGGLLPLPDMDQPEACIVCDDVGVWWIEHGSEQQQGEDQQVLELSSGRWILQLPPPDSSSVATTRTLETSARVLELMEGRFRVSLDEEHIEVTLADELGEIPLGARAHHELLLALARAKLRDRAEELPVGECGWLYVDKVAEMLAIEPQHLTVTVFRARKQIADAGVVNAGALIERRPRSRQMRIGIERLKIDSF